MPSKMAYDARLRAYEILGLHLDLDPCTFLAKFFGTRSNQAMEICHELPPAIRTFKWTACDFATSMVPHIQVWHKR